MGPGALGEDFTLQTLVALMMKDEIEKSYVTLDLFFT